MKLSQGDTVVVTTGKDKGKKGTVMRVLKTENRVIVSGVNMVTKHVKKTSQSAGKKVKFEVSINVSNVAMIDPKTGKPTRIGYKVENGKKVRFAKKSGETLTRVKLAPQTEDSANAKVSAKPEKKAPFWKKVGFGSEAVAGEVIPKSEPESAVAVTPHRSGGRGS